ncbi:hypothetical protein H5T54_02025 [Candidatus Bipolaricaulota bacterium]|nr:hypothetical protein [Candidatus Bipolaricaulota bacterium]
MRRLGIALVCAAAVAVPSVAQLSGSWEATLIVLPSPPGVALETCVLTLAYQVATEWAITSTSTFGTLGLTGQAFGVNGEFGPLSLTGGINFNPQDISAVTVSYPSSCTPQTESVSLTAPAYMSAWFKTELNLFGAGLAFKLNHWAYPYTQDSTDPDDVEDYSWPCCPPQTQSYTLLALIVTAPPATLTARFSDCCTGLAFMDVTLTLSGASLCCGITHDVEVYFTKLGFGYLLFTIDLPLCCGISVEASIMYTVAQKTLSVKPKWNGLGQACFEIYGDVLWDDVMLTITGLAIYGYKLRCDFSSCSYAELLTALDVTKIEAILDSEDLFQGNEFEYVKLGFCGPGCCGGLYTLALAVYFQPSGTLFGFTRIGADLGVPLLANLKLTLSFGVTATGGPTSLSVGWVLTF